MEYLNRTSFLLAYLLKKGTDPVIEASEHLEPQEGKHVKRFINGGTEHQRIRWK